MKIKIFSCGGTFEKIYDPLNGSLAFNESCIPQIIKRSRITVDIEFEPIFFKDSLDMNEHDRQEIATKILDEPIKNVLLIHGTDTMIETARVTKEKKPSNKIIVITGAMVPFSVKESDAMFNFGNAFVAAQLLNPGVWISMNGRIFDPEKVRKNKIEGIFE